MKPEQILPTIFMLEYSAASLVYFWQGKTWNGLYWWFAIGLTYVVTFKLK